MELSCGISLSLRRAAIEAGHHPANTSQSFCVGPFLPVWRKSSPLSRSLVCIPVDIHTHPQLQRNASYFWAPKVIQTSSLFLVLLLLDHCAFSVSPESLRVFDLLATTSSAAYLEGALVLSAVNKFIA